MTEIQTLFYLVYKRFKSHCTVMSRTCITFGVVLGFVRERDIVTETILSSHEFIYELRGCVQQLRRLQTSGQHGPSYWDDDAADWEIFEGGKINGNAHSTKRDCHLRLLTCTTLE